MIGLHDFDEAKINLGDVYKHDSDEAKINVGDCYKRFWHRKNTKQGYFGIHTRKKSNYYSLGFFCKTEEIIPIYGAHTNANFVLGVSHVHSICGNGAFMEFRGTEHIGKAESSWVEPIDTMRRNKVSAR